MLLNNTIDVNNIDLHLEGTTKEALIYGLVQRLYRNQYISDVEQFYKDVMQRESMGLTGIGNGIAIPHGKSSVVNEPCIAIGRIEGGIEWESIDEKPIHVIILFAVNSNDTNNTHIKLLSQVAGKLADEEVCRELRTVEEATDLIKVLSQE